MRYHLTHTERGGHGRVQDASQAFGAACGVLRFVKICEKLARPRQERRAGLAQSHLPRRAQQKRRPVLDPADARAVCHRA